MLGISRYFLTDINHWFEVRGKKQGEKCKKKSGGVILGCRELKEEEVNKRGVKEGRDG